MRGALRPAIAVLLLVGVGLTLTARTSRACPLSRCCASLGDVDDASCVDLDATTPEVVAVPARIEGVVIAQDQPIPHTPTRATHVLADAPKTSPPR